MADGSLRFAGVGLADLPAIAGEIASRVGTVTVWVFRGGLGAGKTTLIKAVGDRLGVTDLMSSPTFALVNEYATAGGGKVFHFDLYRIKSEAEAVDIGIVDYFYSGNPCFIEWAENIPSLVPEEHGEVTIGIEGGDRRTIAISVHDGKEKNRF